MAIGWTYGSLLTLLISMYHSFSDDFVKFSWSQIKEVSFLISLGLLKIKLYYVSESIFLVGNENNMFKKRNKQKTVLKTDSGGLVYFT